MYKRKLRFSLSPDLRYATVELDLERPLIFELPAVFTAVSCEREPPRPKAVASRFVLCRIGVAFQRETPRGKARGIFDHLGKSCGWSHIQSEINNE